MTLARSLSAVSEAPPTQRLNSQLFARGRLRYSTKTSRVKGRNGRLENLICAIITQQSRSVGRWVDTTTEPGYSVLPKRKLAIGAANPAHRRRT